MSIRVRKSPLITALALALALWAAPRAHALEPLKLGIHPYLSSTELTRRFRPLADYLGRELGVPVTIEIADSYASHIRNVGTGVVDIAILGPASYVTLVDSFGPQPILAAFEVDGRKTYRGVIVARRGSAIVSLADIKGTRFAFGDRQSTMGHLVPRQMLLEQGVAARDLPGHQFLANHDNIALGVLGGDFDAGALKEDVFRNYAAEGLKVVAFTQEFGDHVFVAGAKTPAQTAKDIRQALLGLKDRPEGRGVLAAIQKNLAALVPAADREYDNLRAVLKGLKAAGVEP